ncbi:MAG TPA: polyprenyl diphosphate synthase [Polyangia bacterium]|jgi:undecaprenyl diphosphate synthase|nr:polyprenyl diphosphate synthase [Polyangia bacterium]
MKVSFDHRPGRPAHVAIIMDGNGRWAEQHGLPRLAGHERGAEAVRRTVTAACEQGLRALTLYAFSEQNWGRPDIEVAHLLRLLSAFLDQERRELCQRGVRVRAIGDRSRLPASVCAALARTESATIANSGLELCLAISYGGREDLLQATRALCEAAVRGQLRPADIDEQRLGAALGSRGLPPVDLVIRTSGEQRLSNFLLWESAYAELYFTACLWPDFDGEALRLAMAAFRQRDRRFGLVRVAG